MTTSTGFLIDTKDDRQNKTNKKNIFFSSEWSAHSSFCSAGARQPAHSDVASAKTLNTPAHLLLLTGGRGMKAEWEMPREGRSLSAGFQLGDYTVSSLAATYFILPPLAADTQIIIKEDDCHAQADLQAAWTNQSQKLRLTVKASSFLASRLKP